MVFILLLFLNYSNESHTALLRFASFRWCGIRRIKIREQTFLGIQVFLSKSALLFIRDSLLTHKKSTTPGNLMSETVPASAPPGARTLHTLKALGHFISVYYALFCVIKMPAIPLFIRHYGQYKTLWYFIIKCKKFKCLWEGF